jgi:hypothetical protein
MTYLGSDSGVSAYIMITDKKITDKQEYDYPDFITEMKTFTAAELKNYQQSMVKPDGPYD